ncbi:MAG: radical SAM protein [Candidatus Latescibacterota bacterium]
MAFLVSARGLPRYVRRYGHLFTWKRAWNLVCVLLSLALSQVLRRPVVWGRPAMLMVEPTNLCNLKCPLCPSGNGEMHRQRGRMVLERFRGLVDQVHGHVFLMMLWNQGEPYLNSAFGEMVRYAHDHRIFTFTSTNGHFLRTREEARQVVDSGLDEIVFSVDGVDQETYARYRVGGRLERVLEAIRLLLAERRRAGARTPVVNLQFIVMRHNEQDRARAQEVARELEVDKFLVKTAQVYTPQEAAEYLPIEDAYSRYTRSGNGRLQVKGQPGRGCKVLWYSSTVNWNGAVAPCCFDKDVDFPLGDAFDGSPLQRIWRGPAYGAFRRRILQDRRSVPMCTNCSEGYRGMFSLVKELGA